MENLNDLIWTDEDNVASPQELGITMHEMCMIAFCDGGIVGVGGSYNGGTYDTAGNSPACSKDADNRSLACW